MTPPHPPPPFPCTPDPSPKREKMLTIFLRAFSVFCYLKLLKNQIRTAK